jgi:proline-specific peptidase
VEVISGFRRPVWYGREIKEAVMTAKTPHKEAGATVTTKKMTAVASGNHGWPRGSRLLKIRDVSLFAEVRGHGYPIVVMHGGPSADHFTMLPFRQCADQFTVILYDHRCNGRSVGAPVSSMTWENLTADADALRQKLGFERWAVLGHSFGGHVALEYALRYPASLSHLVLLNTGGDAHWEQQNAASLLAKRGYSAKKAELVRRWFNGELTPREYFPMFIRIGAVYHTHLGPWLARDMIHGAWRSRIRPEALIFAGRELLNGWTVTDRLGEITVPTLVIAGRDDGVFPPECQRDLAARIPGSCLHLVDHAGHNPHAEQTAEVMAAIRHFITADAPTT